MILKKEFDDKNNLIPICLLHPCERPILLEDPSISFGYFNLHRRRSAFLLEEIKHKNKKGRRGLEEVDNTKLAT